MLHRHDPGHGDPEVGGVGWRSTWSCWQAKIGFEQMWLVDWLWTVTVCTEQTTSWALGMLRLRSLWHPCPSLIPLSFFTHLLSGYPAGRPGQRCTQLLLEYKLALLVRDLRVSNHQPGC